jgi:hypothetical protein
MIDAEKHYKDTLDREYTNYRKKFSEDIHNLSKNNPKAKPLSKIMLNSFS